MRTLIRTLFISPRTVLTCNVPGHLTKIDTFFCPIGVWIRGVPLYNYSPSLSHTLKDLQQKSASGGDEEKGTETAPQPQLYRRTFSPRRMPQQLPRQQPPHKGTS